MLVFGVYLDTWVMYRTGFLFLPFSLLLFSVGDVVNHLSVDIHHEWICDISPYRPLPLDVVHSIFISLYSLNFSLTYYVNEYS
jgi:hypothetical protein